MILPLSALLYKLSRTTDYDMQDVDISLYYEDIKLYEPGFEHLFEKNSLIYISDQTISSISDSEMQKNGIVFLCYCSQIQPETEEKPLHKNIVYLYPKNNESYSAVFNTIVSIFNIFRSWDQLFHLKLLNHASMQKLLNITSPILSHSMLVLDNDLRIIGHVIKDHDYYMEEILKHGHISDEKYPEYTERGFFPKSFDDPLPHINSYTDSSGIRRYSISYLLREGTTFYGYVMIFHCNNHPSVSYQYLTDMVIDNLMLYFRQDSFSAKNTAEQYQIVLAKLIQDEGVSPYRLNTMLKNTDVLPAKGYFLLARAFFSKNDNLPKSIIMRSIKSSFSKMRPFLYNGTVYILLVSQEPSDVLNDFLPEEKVSPFLYCFSSQLDFCTVSLPFYSLDMLSTASKQCEIAYELSDIKNRTDIFIYYKDLAFKYFNNTFLSAASSSMSASVYYDILKNYDNENGTKLCQIVYDYLIHSRSISQTAESSFLHRNTVLNSLKKAFSIMNNGLENFDDEFFFILNYRNET